MLGSIIQQNPLFAGVIAAIIAVLLILILSAVVSSRWSRRKVETVVADPVRREPVFVGEEGEPQAERPPERITYTEAEPYRPPLQEHPERPRRGRFGFAALSMAFLTGLVAGVGTMTLSSSGQLRSALRSFVALAETVLPQDEEADAPGAAPRAEQVVAVPEADKADPAPSLPSFDAEKREVAARLAAFADRLKQTLPRDAGPELVLTGVETSGMTVNLSYAVGRPVPKVEVAAFDAYVMRAVKSLFCGKESRELRYLNDNGVAFHMAYVDPDGETVAKLTIPADFCA